MEDKNFCTEKINILEVVKEGLHLCKGNYKSLLLICFISFVIFLFNTLLSYIKLMLTPGWINSIYTTISFIVLFPIAYLDMKLTVSLWILISKCYSNERVSVKEAFALSARTIWSYIGTSILYSLMLVPILVIFVPLFLMIQVAILKWILISLLVMLIVYLGTVYGFAPIAAALEGAKERNFRLSKTLVKGNFLRIMILQLVIEAIGLSGLLTTNLNPWFKASSVATQYVIQISYHFAYMFITPFLTTISIVLFLLLRKKVVFYETGDLPDTMQI